MAKAPLDKASREGRSDNKSSINPGAQDALAMEMGDSELASARLGDHLLPLICPYCHAKLIKRQKWLLCRYHKIGFEIISFGVDFKWDRALRSIEGLEKKVGEGYGERGR